MRLLLRVYMYIFTQYPKTYTKPFQPLLLNWMILSPTCTQALWNILHMLNINARLTFTICFKEHFSLIPVTHEHNNNSQISLHLKKERTIVQAFHCTHTFTNYREFYNQSWGLKWSIYDPGRVEFRVISNARLPRVLNGPFNTKDGLDSV